jgi:hypothetical protein
MDRPDRIGDRLEPDIHVAIGATSLPGHREN